MRRLIDQEVEALRKEKKLVLNEDYHSPETGDVHGNA